MADFCPVNHYLDKASRNVRSALEIVRRDYNAMAEIVARGGEPNFDLGVRFVALEEIDQTLDRIREEGA